MSADILGVSVPDMSLLLPLPTRIERVWDRQARRAVVKAARRYHCFLIDQLNLCI